jgi:hypothetical protein
MGIHDLPKKWRDRAPGDATALACADELEAHLRDALLCYISDGPEILIEVVLPDAVFKATMRKPSSCAISTRSGDTQTASLHFL